MGNKRKHSRDFFLHSLCWKGSEPKVHTTKKYLWWNKWNALLKLQFKNKITRRLRKILTGRKQSKFQTIWKIHILLNPLIFNNYKSFLLLLIKQIYLVFIPSWTASSHSTCLSFVIVHKNNYHSVQKIHKQYNTTGIK